MTCYSSVTNQDALGSSGGYKLQIKEKKIAVKNNNNKLKWKKKVKSRHLDRVNATSLA